MNSVSTQSELVRAVPENDGGGTDGFHPGTGNSDLNFLVVENTDFGVEAALKAKGRYAGDLASDGTTYYTTTGISSGSAGSWNFDYSVVDFGADADISDFTIVISADFTDAAGTVSTDIMSFDAVAHAATTEEYYYQDPSDQTEGLQNSQNIGWYAAGFDASAPGTYSLTMTVSDRTTGEVVAAPQIRIEVSANVTVGENGLETIQEAIDAASNGDTIYIPAGTYNETLVIDKQVTLVGAQTGIDARSDTREGASETVIEGGILLRDGADGSTVDGITLVGGDVLSGSKAGIYLSAGVSSVSVENSILSRTDGSLDSGYRGILTVSNGANTDLTVSQSSFSGWSTGIYLNPGGTGARIADNAFDGNNVGISGDGPDNLSIEGNSFTNNAYEAIGLGPSSGTSSPLTADISYNTFGAGNGTATGDVIGVYDASIQVTDRTPDLSISGPSGVTEGSGTSAASYSFSLSATSTRDTTVTWRTVEGSASAGSDFSATTAGSAVIPAGDTVVTVTVPVLGDSAVEGNETFSVEITGVNFANLSGTRTVTTTILNDDSPPADTSDGGGSNDDQSTGGGEVVVSTTTGTSASGSQTVIQTVTNTNSVESSSVTLIDNASGGAANTVSAAIPALVGLTQEGSATSETPSDTARNLASFIEQASSGAGSTGGAGPLAINAVTTWTQGLDPAASIDVRKISFQVSSDTAPSEAIVITGSDSSATGAFEAFVLDVSQMPAGTTLELHDLDFASVVGATRIVGGTGDNYVIADDNEQYIVLGADNDTLLGGGGNDTIGSEGGDDILYGNQGNDSVFGGGGSDQLFGGAEDDIAYGNAGADIVRGNRGSDTLFGGQQNDVVYGNTGGDLIFGNRDNDTLYGGQGADTIFGQSGNDFLVGGRGDDTLYGGDGQDIFVLGASGGADTIVDFTVEDRLQIVVDGTEISQFSDLVIFSDSAGDLGVMLSDGASFTLRGVSASEQSEVALDLVSEGRVLRSGDLEHAAVDLIGVVPSSDSYLFG